MTKVSCWFIGEPKVAKRIKDLEPGESGFCVPWAFDPVNFKLDDSFTVLDKPGGTVTMMVSRNSEGEYTVDLRNIDYEY